MPIILETEKFIVKAHDQPHHSRENGGHVVITPKERFQQRYEMPLNTAYPLMGLSLIVGEALTNVMRSKGMDVIRINYQDNGNWAYKEPVTEPRIHLHLYVRTSHEKHLRDDPRFQAFPDALVFPDRSTGFYDSFEPLTPEDCLDIKNEIDKLHRSNKYESIILL